MSTLDQIQQTSKQRCLLANLKKSVEFWNQTKNKYEDTASEQIRRALLDILLNGLIFPTLIVSPLTETFTTLDKQTGGGALHKLIEDFQWLSRTTHIRNSPTDNIGLSSALAAAETAYEVPAHTMTTSPMQNIAKFLCSWIAQNLQSHCLCSCLQTLVIEKDLLNSYYREEAFLRNEPYATALFICISAFELNQCSLLSQIDSNLYSLTVGITALPHTAYYNKHKRTRSHPIFSVSPPDRSIVSPPDKAVVMSNTCVSVRPSERIRSPQENTVFPNLRKIKSLPELETERQREYGENPIYKRPRSKTIAAHKRVRQCIKSASTQPQQIPRSNWLNRTNLNANIRTPDSNVCSLSSEDLQPSVASLGSGRRSEESNYILNSPTHSHSNSLSQSTTAHSTPTSRRIELIKCDDIKIWTDQSCEQQLGTREPSKSFDIPRNAVSTKPKSVSPINSFLCSLFSTPPTYTSWSLSENSYDETTLLTTDTTAVAAASTRIAYPCNNQPKDMNNSGVFDSFLPVYGQKLRSRKSQNLFDEDGTNSVDYSSASTCINDECEPSDGHNRGIDVVTPKSTQSLTAFLQMSHLSRNNTELEKENAHFRISEAIISAIEHIKWAKLEPDKGQPHEDAAKATDWLENENITSKVSQYDKNTLSGDDHIPYAELGENSLDLLSAEVVGLTLISKFDDKHLPKVSELRWLVSEDDAPQQLLPMPDNSPTANPDENVIPSMTRGTKYWAPPRQQIIFTDHPPPNRKQLIQKQNNRCTGCGMRVAPQYLHSFRYCTYLGKYFCTGCHRNQISAIPAKILQLWDFKCYPVSVFAYRLLDLMFTYPLFYVPDLNAALYVKSKVLLAARNKRIQLKYIKDFVKTCRFAVREQTFFDSVPYYITDDPDIWSMSDFIDARNKSMQRSIDELIEKCSNHIYNCVLCSARGFICEYCRSTKVIYPWERRAARCDRCGSCFHLNCWRSMLEMCCRCQRLNKRRDQITIVDI